MNRKSKTIDWLRTERILVHHSICATCSRTVEINCKANLTAFPI